ncbi:MAG: xylulokinase [Jiangellales bacterium]
MVGLDGYVLGIDSSTTATKAVLVRADGTVAGVGVGEYGFEAPHPGWSEQSPHLWWTATQQAIAAALIEAGADGSAVTSVGLTGQMHGSVLLDAAGDVVRPALLWNDQRTAGECDEIRDRVGAARLIELTGNDALTGFTAPKMLWVRRHEPDAWARVAHVMLPKDYIRYRLTGAIATDVADASGTLLLDVAHRHWSSDVLAALDLEPGLLPELLEGPELSGVVSAGAAALTGLAVGTPVVAGGGDQAANAVGVGAVRDDVGALSLGTSGVVFVPTSRPVVEPEGRVHSFCHAVPDTWHVMGVMLSAAGSLRWYRDTLAPDVDFGALVAEAGPVAPGADGLRFLPYLTGERTPHPDPQARGAFVGLTVRHTRAHLTRAVLEGVAFGLRDGLELMRDAGVGMPGEFRASGGGTKSPLWRQVVADVLDVPVVTVGTAEGAAFGAAVLAAVGAGWFRSVTEAEVALVRTGERTEPADADAYSGGYASYRSLYPALQPVFGRLDG